MSAYVQAVVHFAEGHAVLVYALALVATGMESIAIVGLLVPGSAIIVALGVLVPSGAVGFWWLCFWSIAGALAGDGISYWVGRSQRDRLRTIWPFSRHPAALAAGERFFADHGGKSVFLARFVAPVRGTVPAIAGMARMAPGRFFAVNVLSALGWAPAHILPGALIGAGLTLTGAVASRLLVLSLVLGLLLWMAAKAAALAVRHGVPALAAAQERAARWARGRDGWMARQVLALLDPARGEARALALFGVVLVAALWTFLAVIEDVFTGDPLVQADTAIYNLLQGLRSLAADRAMIAVTELGGTTVAGAITAAVALWLAWRRAWHAVAYWIAAVGGASLFGLLLKIALHVPRPTSLYTGWDAFSFPSGHATVSAALYGFLAVLLAHGARPAWRVPIAATIGLFIALIGFSRLYLGAHWLSDVIGGFAFGIAWVSLLAIAYLRHSPPRLPTATLAAIPLVVLAGVGTAQIAHKMPDDMQRYAARPASMRAMTTADWWRDGWRTVPARRVDLAGAGEEPLVLQWAGEVEPLQRLLTAAGWRPAAPWSVATALNWLGADPSPLSLPVLPRLHDGRAPALTLIHADSSHGQPAARWVLRLWATGTALSGADGKTRPLWVGAVSRQQFGGALAPFGVGFERSRIVPPWPLLQQALPAARLESRSAGRAGTRLMLARDPALAADNRN